LRDSTTTKYHDYLIKIHYQAMATTIFENPDGRIELWHKCIISYI